MSYLGNTPTTQSFISGTDYFNGTGSQTAFTLTRTVNSVNDIEAVVNNVVQQPNSAYTLSGTTITFTSAPSAGTNNIYVRYLSTTTQSITPAQNTVSYSTMNTDMQGLFGQSFTNRIINGAMVIDQRNAGASVTPSGTDTSQYCLDRFYLRYSVGSKLSVQQSTTAPAGFKNSQLLTSLSAYSIGASEHFNVIQPIEGLNVADLNWGTASAATVTISFWVRSSLTGTFGGNITNNAADRSYVFSYTINAADTWEQKIITVAGDTSGTWLTTNGIGLYLSFSLGAGSSVTKAAGSWGSFARSVTGQTSVVGTNGATFYITGVQLEKGSTATSFDYRPYGTELALCQRYYYQINGGAAGNVWIPMATAYAADGLQGSLSFPVTMRAAPSISFAGVWAAEDGLVKKTSTATSFGGISTSITGANMYLSGFSGLTTYRPYYTFGNTSSSSFNISAEL